MRQAHNAIDLTGKNFGRLVCISARTEFRSGRNKRFWTCQCACGNITEVETSSLRSGNTRSCGCFRAESERERAVTHGLSHTRTHRIYLLMIDRCSRPSANQYPNYGGRGIKVCERWLSGFDAFFEDMGHPPTERHSIDRINNDGNYEPSNCRWATSREQGRNRRGLLMVNFKGSQVCLKEACEALDLHYGTVHSRIRKWGWSPEEAIACSTPSRYAR